MLIVNQVQHDGFSIKMTHNCHLEIDSEFFYEFIIGV